MITGLQLVQEFGGPLRMAGRLHDESLVVFQCFEPASNVGRVIVPNLGRELKTAAAGSGEPYALGSPPPGACMPRTFLLETVQHPILDAVAIWTHPVAPNGLIFHDRRPPRASTLRRWSAVTRDDLATASHEFWLIRDQLNEIYGVRSAPPL